MADNNTISLVSPSLSDITNRFIDIQKKYIGDDNYFLSTGFFGYMNETNASMLRDSIFHRVSIYNESYLNLAVMPKSIYNWAKLFNVNVTAATPAYIDVNIEVDSETLTSSLIATSSTINEYELEKYGESFNNYKHIIIDRDNPIKINDYKFYLEKSIIIKEISQTTSSGTTNVYIDAQYLQKEPITTNFSANNGYDQVFLNTRISGSTFILSARVYQYDVTTVSRQITSGNVFLSKIHTFTFTNQFVKAILYYVKDNVREKIELFFNESSATLQQVENYAFYSLTDENELQIKFSSESGAFTPDANSTLELHIYTTYAANTPSQLIGVGQYSTTISNIQNSSFYNKLAVKFNGNMLGGLNTPPLSQIKQTIINEISVRKVLITENDLNLFFNQLSILLNNISNSQVRFIKRRDDILKRTFDTYILLRDGLDINKNTVNNSSYTSACIPTNTITVDFPISTGSSKSLGTIVKRKTGTINEYEYASNIIETDPDYYVIPFYTRIITSPINVVKYVYNLTDGSAQMSTLSVNDENTVYANPKECSIYRGLSNGRANPAYQIKITINSDVDIARKFQENTSSLNLKILNGVTNVEIDSLTFSKQTLIDVSSIQSSDGTSYDSTFTIALEVAKNEFDFSEQNTSSNFGTYINCVNVLQQVIQLPETVYFQIEFDGLDFGSNLILSSAYKTNKPLTLFRSLDDIMSSDMILKKKTVYKLINADKTINKVSENPITAGDGQEVETETLINSIQVKDIPVVHNSYFTSVSSQQNFINQMFSYIDMLRANINKLETNTFFNIKFYNTYGPSYMTTEETTNLKLEMNIKLRSPELLTLENKQYIMDFIRLFVDNSNNNGIFAISNLQTAMENDGIIKTLVEYSEFKMLNGTLNQSDSYNNIQSNIYPLEWFNISRDELNSDNIVFEV